MLSPVGVDTAVTWLSVGPVVSIVKELTCKLLLVLPVLSVTVMMQLLTLPAKMLLVRVVAPTGFEPVT